MSLIVEGVFVKFPKLTTVFVEGGIGWIPHLMWRLDKNFKSLRSQAPWLNQLPSEYILDNCRFTSQPIEEPEDPEHLNQILKMMSADQISMFSSDYPHWDLDNPFWALNAVPDETRERILYDNAASLYLGGR